MLTTLCHLTSGLGFSGSNSQELPVGRGQRPLQSLVGAPYFGCQPSGQEGCSRDVCNIVRYTPAQRLLVGLRLTSGHFAACFLSLDKPRAVTPNRPAMPPSAPNVPSISFLDRCKASTQGSCQLQRASTCFSPSRQCTLSSYPQNL